MNSRCGQTSRTSSLGTRGPKRTHSFEEDSEVVARGVCNIEVNQSSEKFRNSPKFRSIGQMCDQSKWPTQNSVQMSQMAEIT